MIGTVCSDETRLDSSLFVCKDGAKDETAKDCCSTSVILPARLLASQQLIFKVNLETSIFNPQNTKQQIVCDDIVAIGL